MVNVDIFFCVFGHCVRDQEKIVPAPPMNIENVSLFDCSSPNTQWRETDISGFVESTIQSDGENNAIFMIKNLVCLLKNGRRE